MGQVPQGNQTKGSDKQVELPCTWGILVHKSRRVSNGTSKPDWPFTKEDRSSLIYKYINALPLTNGVLGGTDLVVNIIMVIIIYVLN